MKIIEGQIVATTNVDAYGTRIPPEALRALFGELPDQFLIRDSHDLVRAPAGVGKNKRLVDLPGGEIGIAVDIEVHNEQALVGKLGVSIAAVQTELSLRADCDPDLRIHYDPRDFEDRDLAPLVHLTDDEFQVNAARTIRRGLEDLPLTLVLKFGVATYATGFLARAGARHYDALHDKLAELASRKRKVDPGRELLIQTQWEHVVGDGRRTEVVAQAPADVLSVMDSSRTAVLEARIARRAEQGAAHLGFRFDREAGSWEETYAVDEVGRDVRGA